MLKRLASSLAALVLIALVTAAAAAAAREPNVPHETFFPRVGTTSYDAGHYDVDLSYAPSSGYLKATANINAIANRRLSDVVFDLDGLRVTSAEVDGEAAKVSRGRQKLKLGLRLPIAKGNEFEVVVHYQGHPRRVIDPDGSPEGWYRTADGAIAVGEPVGTAAWLPCNNIPSDKASTSVAITVPAGLQGVSNGRLLGVSRRGARRTFQWFESTPMSTYLAVVDIGRGRLVRSRIGNLPSWTLVDPALAVESRKALAQLPEIVHFETGIFGPYPFDALGSIVDPAELGYALETQTRPIYAFAPNIPVVVHETAHQWFGDSVGLRRWPEIWLNEGFATFTEWFYAEHHGRRTARQIFHDLYRVPASNTGFWEPPSGHPGSPKNLFATSTYVRGGMTLEALRVRIGTQDLLHLLRRWVGLHRESSGTIPQFVELAETISGKRLQGFFDRWLFERAKPAGFGAI